MWSNRHRNFQMCGIYNISLHKWQTRHLGYTVKSLSNEGYSVWLVTKSSSFVAKSAFLILRIVPSSRNRENGTVPTGRLLTFSNVISSLHFVRANARWQTHFGLTILVFPNISLKVTISDLEIALFLCLSVIHFSKDRSIMWCPFSIDVGKDE